jgi:hypothetical protein
MNPEVLKWVSVSRYRSGLDKLRAILVHARQGDKEFQDMVGAKDAVLARFGRLFTAEGIKNLEADQLKPFLLFENNHHWTSLNRQGDRLFSNMEQLRSALALLLDEQKPIAARWDSVAGTVFGMGKAKMSAILTIAHPELYGVWNNTSEGGLKAKAVGLWPDFNHGTGSGQKYEAVNQLLNELAKDLQIDLWTLDALFWQTKSENGDGDQCSTTPGGTPPPDSEQRFGLEQHLQDFLFENWDKTELGKEWELYAEDGDAESAYEYPTDVGEIDLLAKHRRESRWLVVELKRGQTSDATVGQILRYIAWVRQHLAKPKQQVEGLIIAQSVDEKLRYAVSELPHVKVMEYRVSFDLHAVSPVASA